MAVTIEHRSLEYNDHNATENEDEADDLGNMSTTALNACSTSNENFRNAGRFFRPQDIS